MMLSLSSLGDLTSRTQPAAIAVSRLMTIKVINTFLQTSSPDSQEMVGLALCILGILMQRTSKSGRGYGTGIKLGNNKER